MDRPNPSGFLLADRYGYDGAHRLTSATDPVSHPVRTSTYDAAGRLATDTDGDSNVTSYAYDVPGHTTTTTYPDTGVTVQTFDDNGMLLSLDDQLGNTTSTSTTPTGTRPSGRTRSAKSRRTPTTRTETRRRARTSLDETTTTTYNAFSEPLTTTNPIGNTTTIAYDATGLPTTLHGQHGTAGDVHLVRARAAQHGNGRRRATSSFSSYDASGDLTQRTDRLGRVTGYAYTGSGQKDTVTDRAGRSHLVPLRRRPPQHRHDQRRGDRALE